MSKLHYRNPQYPLGKTWGESRSASRPRTGSTNRQALLAHTRIRSISSQNNNVLKHLTSRANEGRVSSSLDLCRMQPRMAESNFTRNQAGMQMKIRANESRTKLVWVMPSAAEFGRSQHSGSDTSAVKHQGLRYAWISAALGIAWASSALHSLARNLSQKNTTLRAWRFFSGIHLVLV